VFIPLEITYDKMEEALALSYEHDLSLLKRLCFKQLESLDSDSINFRKEFSHLNEFSGIVVEFLEFLSEKRRFAD